MFQATDTPATAAGEGGPERWAWVRYPCSLEVSCQVPAPPPANACAARARDISPHGLALTLNRETEPGTVVSVQLHTPAGRARRPVPH